MNWLNDPYIQRPLDNSFCTSLVFILLNLMNNSLISFHELFMHLQFSLKLSCVYLSELFLFQFSLSVFLDKSDNECILPVKDFELLFPSVLARVEFPWFILFQDAFVVLYGGEDPLSGIGFKLLRLCGNRKLTQVPILANRLIYEGNALPSNRIQNSSAKWLQF